uniref:Uncharacterized protein n=1 Tax=Ananas comosus var. bracteatus TaxID=296719 RepID=A0A6V7PJH1_ANACO|nr:unnamed protein product [Ananas comosus var. bracteatus]
MKNTAFSPPPPPTSLYPTPHHHHHHLLLLFRQPLQPPPPLPQTLQSPPSPPPLTPSPLRRLRRGLRAPSMGFNDRALRRRLQRPLPPHPAPADPAQCPQPPVRQPRRPPRRPLARDAHRASGEPDPALLLCEEEGERGYRRPDARRGLHLCGLGAVSRSRGHGAARLLGDLRVVLLGLVLNFMNYFGRLDSGLWLLWEDFITVSGLSVLPQVMWSTFVPSIPNSILPGIVSCTVAVAVVSMARIGKLPEDWVKFVRSISGWTATLLFMWMPIAQMWTTYLNPDNIKGLSALTILLGMIGNALMIPRALFIRDLMCFDSISSAFFFPATLSLFLWIGKLSFPIQLWNLHELQIVLLIAGSEGNCVQVNPVADMQFNCSKNLKILRRS